MELSTFAAAGTDLLQPRKLSHQIIATIFYTSTLPYLQSVYWQKLLIIHYENDFYIYNLIFRNGKISLSHYHYYLCTRFDWVEKCYSDVATFTGRVILGSFFLYNLTPDYLQTTRLSFNNIVYKVNIKSSVSFRDFYLLGAFKS